MKEFVQVWYTQWKHNRPVESGPIEWKELKEAFLGNYLTRETKEVNNEDFINIRKSNMSVEKYYLTFTLLSNMLNLLCLTLEIR